MSDAEALLAVAGVSKRFGGLAALDGVSLAVRPSEIFGLIGPNGAGKTTLFNVVSGYYAPTEGKVLFDGKDVGGKPPYALAAMGIGRTFQVVKPLAGLSVLENVAGTNSGYQGRATSWPRPCSDSRWPPSP